MIMGNDCGPRAVEYARQCGYDFIFPSATSTGPRHLAPKDSASRAAQPDGRPTPVPATRLSCVPGIVPTAVARPSQQRAATVDPTAPGAAGYRLVPLLRCRDLLFGGLVVGLASWLSWMLGAAVVT